MTNSNATRARSSDDASLQDHALALLDDEIDRLVRELAGDAPLVERMGRFHLGLVTPSGDPVSSEERARYQGKRIRPLIAMLACSVAGGSLDDASSLAASIELLHNFTLVHDDIQDRSPNRRHRPTVWRIWGDAQAINAGDALFAAAQIGVLDNTRSQVTTEQLVVISRAFNRMTIDIVRGQVLDIEFEARDDVTPDEYLHMIRGKTAAIVEFAAWAGATLGGASSEDARTFSEFGQALGLGFQIRDDALGAWGSSAETGKDTADDIRRRKKTLPMVTLRALAHEEDRLALKNMFGKSPIAEDDVMAILSMLERYDVANQIDQRVRRFHDKAEAALQRLDDHCEPRALDALQHLVDRLAIRST